jgi:hypothetical protein
MNETITAISTNTGSINNWQSLIRQDTLSISTNSALGTYFTPSSVSISSTSANFTLILASNSSRKGGNLNSDSSYRIFYSSWAALHISTATCPSFGNEGLPIRHTGAIYGEAQDGSPAILTGIEEDQ